MSCAPFLIALSSSGNRNESVSRESSVHSMTSISSPLMKSISPMLDTLSRKLERAKREVRDGGRASRRRGSSSASTRADYSKHPMPADARFLHCPSCGAAVERSGRCPYCRGRLATVSCPSCFALMFDGARSASSAARAAAAAKGGGRRPARGAGTRVQQVTLGSTTLLECAALRRRVGRRRARSSGSCADRESQAAVLHAARHGQRGPAQRLHVQLPAVPALRQDDEPRQLRPAVRRRRRRLQGPRHVPRRRRAAPDRHVHPARAGSSARGRSRRKTIRKEEAAAACAKRERRSWPATGAQAGRRAVERRRCR